MVLWLNVQKPTLVKARAQAVAQREAMRKEAGLVHAGEAMKHSAWLVDLGQQKPLVDGDS